VVGSTSATARREWCPRCGTSLSQHELSQSGVYQERADPSLFVRLPLKENPHESLVIWTTTPWTLPANVAAAVKPDAEYGLRENGEWVAVARYPDETFTRTVRGEELVGLRYEGPFDTLSPGASVEHRVIPWDDVTLDQGTGIVHIAPGCGGEDFELSKVHDLPVLMPVDEAGRFYDEFGWLHRLSTVEAADQIVGDLKERGLLVEAGLYEHAYPHCWRCDTPAHLPHRRRLVHRRRGSEAATARRRMRPSTGHRSTWASAWTTGCETWAIGTSRVAASTGCRSRSTAARADT
jgi:isoleucyl-tRNA synthetase